MRRLIVLVVTAALAVATPAIASPHSDRPVAVRVADERATPETRSLFAYLRAQRGQGVLFGHQQTTEFGLTFPTADGVSSDVKAGVGDHPASAAPSSPTGRTATCTGTRESWTPSRPTRTPAGPPMR